MTTSHENRKLNVRALVNRIIMVNTDMNKYTSPSTFPRRKSVRLPTSLNLLLAFARIFLAYIQQAQNGKIRRAKRSVRRLSLLSSLYFGCHATLPGKRKRCVTSQETAAKEVFLFLGCY